MKNCDRCSVAFQHKKATARYCTPKCRKLAFQSRSVPDENAKKVSVPEVSVPADKHTMIADNGQPVIIPENPDGRQYNGGTIAIRMRGTHCAEHCYTSHLHCHRCRDESGGSFTGAPVPPVKEKLQQIIDAIPPRREPLYTEQNYQSGDYAEPAIAL